MKKLIAIFGVLVVSTAMFVGCGSKEAPIATEAPVATEAPATLVPETPAAN